MLASRTRAATPYAAWVAACALAEGVGMTAAAGAARFADPLGTAAGLAVVVAGGLVEGTALGWAQSHVLVRLAPTLTRRRYLVATVLVAGLGWAGASAPAALGSGGSGADQPPLALILLGAAGLGLAMGPALGAAQAIALRGTVPHPWRWVAANTAAWPVAMTVIFLGATAPDTTWPVWSVLVLGTVTGVVAGGLLGVVSGWFLPSLTGATGVDRTGWYWRPAPRAADRGGNAS
ncbi:MULTISPECIES: hypothetical protein [unclassified Nocardioides]|uniref:hypothetical protein n=1 Tax=unclassified Nocardioides TaxID=2615069 RepID=UPI000056F815|nr:MULTISPECIES: hypothetical protein [unclassified Nocardioides]ABL80507.1 hypothetical protein Noca_0986 [Nocardioides sp. JS614]